MMSNWWTQAFFVNKYGGQMKKNGFTLIEILVVIVLLAAVSVTVGVNMSGMAERQKEKQIKTYKETLEKAACVYAETNNILTDSEVTIKTLIDEGLVNKNLKNPETNDPVSKYENDIVQIKWNNNEKKCSLKTS